MSSLDAVALRHATPVRVAAKAGTEVHPPANGNYAQTGVGSPHPPVTAGTLVQTSPTAAGTVVHPPVTGTVVHPPVTQCVFHPPAGRTDGVEEPGPYVAADPGPMIDRRRRL